TDHGRGDWRSRSRRARRRYTFITMPTQVVMPQMGESVAEGTIVRWIKKVGDAVERDEPLFEISTDKVDAEIPSPAAGVIAEIRVKEGETVPVNSVVAVIGEAGSKPAAQAPTPPAKAPEPPKPSPQADGTPAAAGQVEAQDTTPQAQDVPRPAQNAVQNVGSGLQAGPARPAPA